jgi:hypothetical protein
LPCRFFRPPASFARLVHVRRRAPRRPRHFLPGCAPHPPRGVLLICLALVLAKDTDAADVLYEQVHTLRAIDQIRARVSSSSVRRRGCRDRQAVLEGGFGSDGCDDIYGHRQRHSADLAGASDHERAAQYFIVTALALFHELQAQVAIGQVEKLWAIADEVGGGRVFARGLRGKTVGVLAYDHVRLH